MARKDGKYKKAKRCTKKAKSSGKQCKNPALPGKDCCRIHGGLTPVKTGLYTKYPDAIAGEHMDAAKRVGAIAALGQTIPVLVATMSLWVEKGIVFSPKNYLAVCTLMAKITNAIETLEKLTNPELRKGRLELTGQGGGPIEYHNTAEAAKQKILDRLSQADKRGAKKRNSRKPK